MRLMAGVERIGEYAGREVPSCPIFNVRRSILLDVSIEFSQEFYAALESKV
ncbi:hypothetical protein FHW03_004253 [Ochrobactrum sp. RH2CCR150]|nr:hypothetical protein [Ochrobactrum sp. RH2CCR150]